MEMIPELFGPAFEVHEVTPLVPDRDQFTAPNGATAPLTPVTLAW
jgi:hypothetical protein